jgi:hypothetical protein
MPTNKEIHLSEIEKAFLNDARLSCSDRAKVSGIFVASLDVEQGDVSA